MHATGLRISHQVSLEHMSVFDLMADHMNCKTDQNPCCMGNWRSDWCVAYRCTVLRSAHRYENLQARHGRLQQSELLSAAREGPRTANGSRVPIVSKKIWALAHNEGTVACRPCRDLSLSSVQAGLSRHGSALKSPVVPDKGDNQQRRGDLGVDRRLERYCHRLEEDGPAWSASQYAAVPHLTWPGR